MPRGPKGEKRPADVIGAAVRVAKIATGEIEEKPKAAGSIQGREGRRRGASAATLKRGSGPQRPHLNDVNGILHDRHSTAAPLNRSVDAETKTNF